MSAWGNTVSVLGKVGATSGYLNVIFNSITLAAHDNTEIPDAKRHCDKTNSLGKMGSKLAEIDE